MDGDSLIWVTCWFDLMKDDIWEHQKFLFFSYLWFILLAWSLLLLARPLVILSNIVSSLYFFFIPSTLLAVYTPHNPFLLSFHILNWTELKWTELNWTEMNWTELNRTILYSNPQLLCTLLFSSLLCTTLLVVVVWASDEIVLNISLRFHLLQYLWRF